jgi:hypothetical protein
MTETKTCGDENYKRFEEEMCIHAWNLKSKQAISKTR